MPIQSIANNPIQIGGTTGDLLGFVGAEVDEALELSIYDFLIEEIRRADAEDGGLFVQRYLMGPQQVWAENQARIFALKNIWSATDAPKNILQFLKNIVGWTAKYNSITSRLDERGLRRLIANSVAFWKSRGSETSLKNILTLLTGTRMKIVNWFQTRWIVDEAGLDEKRLGYDVTLINSPLQAAMDENRSQIRIVDDGTLDHDIVLGILRLTRPVGERFDVVFLRFFEDFEIDGDVSQWTASAGLINVATGAASLAAAPATAFASVPDSDTWSNFVSYWRMSGTGTFGAFFLGDNAGNLGYRVRLDVAASTVELLVNGGSLGVVNTRACAHPFTLDTGFHGIRVVATPEHGSQRIQVYIDGEQLFNLTNNTRTSGTVGFFASAASTISCEEVEMALLPIDNATVDINT